MRRYRGLRSRADIKQVGFQAVKPTVGKVFIQDSNVRFLRRRVFMHESKENQPDSFGDAPVIRRDMEDVGAGWTH